MSTIVGDYVPDAGGIIIGERRIDAALGRVHACRGVHMIHEEFPAAPTLSVVGNVSLGQLPASS